MEDKEENFNSVAVEAVAEMIREAETVSMVKNGFKPLHGLI
jgi:hypothetical protein